ncbi:hypothetical protein OHW85_23260 [Acinetobacter baumannii]|nr:hypothetical protein [Acinetobacter baumannii]
MSSLQTKVWQQIAGLVPLATDFLFIPVILQAACVLATLVTRPVHGPRLCEAAANSVQIYSRQICHPNHLPMLAHRDLFACRLPATRII